MTLTRLTGGPWKVDVKPNPVPPELIQQIRALVPQNAALWERLFSEATNGERQLLIRELTSLVKRTPFEDSPEVQDLPAPEPVITLPGPTQTLGPAGDAVRLFLLLLLSLSCTPSLSPSPSPSNLSPILR